MPDDTSERRDDGFSFDLGVPGGDDGELETLFGVLGNRRARCVLTHLESATVETMALDHLVDHVVEREVADRDEHERDPDEHRRRVAIALHHNLLPKLADAGLLDYDSRSKTVRYRGDDRLAPCFALFGADEEP